VYVHVCMQGHTGMYLDIVGGSIYEHTHIGYTYKLHTKTYVRVQFHSEGEDPDDFMTLIGESTYQLELSNNVIRPGGVPRRELRKKLILTLS